MDCKKTRLKQSIQKEAHKLSDALAKVPFERRTLLAIGNASEKKCVADILAYLIGWGSLLLGWVEAGKKGIHPLMPGDGFTKWDYRGLAVHFYKKYRYDAGAKQEAEFERIVHEILSIVESEVGKDLNWPWCTLLSGKKWPLEKWITVNSAAPYKRAAAEIRAFLKNSP